MHSIDRNGKLIPRIKVCGVTLLSDLDMLAGAGVDTVGLNFVERSPRFLSRQRGQELSLRAAELGIKRVAVTMNLTAGELSDLLSQVEVDFIQLHGQERPELTKACRGIPVIKATSWTGRTEEIELVEAWQSKIGTRELVAWLIDAYAPAAGGGTGRMARWELLHPRPKALQGLPIILAGGLTPDNVAQAVQATMADGVDTASGVELRPGIKSAQLVQHFANNLSGLWPFPTDN
jgi:phosphoribosylanthranilate isomerase